MTLRFHPLVRRDVREILSHYDGRSDTAGDRFFGELEAATEAIKGDPLRFRLIDVHRRRFNLKQFPYHLLHEMEGGEIYLLVVRHHRRDPKYGLRRKRK